MKQKKFRIAGGSIKYKSVIQHNNQIQCSNKKLKPLHKGKLKLIFSFNLKLFFSFYKICLNSKISGFLSCKMQNKQSRCCYYFFFVYLAKQKDIRVCMYSLREKEELNIKIKIIRFSLFLLHISVYELIISLALALYHFIFRKAKDVHTDWRKIGYIYTIPDTSMRRENVNRKWENKCMAKEGRKREYHCAWMLCTTCVFEKANFIFISWLWLLCIRFFCYYFVCTWKRFRFFLLWQK